MKIDALELTGDDIAEHEAAGGAVDNPRSILTEAHRAALREVLGDDVRFDEPMRRHTTLKIGGPAALVVTPESEEALVAAMPRIVESGLPVFVMGNGSNLLVSDAGFPGVVIRIGSALGDVAAEGPDRLRIGAGAMWSRVLRSLVQEGWTGLEFGAGIPGTLGGAVATHVRVGSPLATHVLFPVYVAAFVWGGLALRHPRLRAVLLEGR